MQMSSEAIFIFIAAFAILLVILLKLFSGKAQTRKRLIMEGAAELDLGDDDLARFENENLNSKIPLVRAISLKLVHGGLKISATNFITTVFIIFLLITYILGVVFANFILGFLLAATATYITTNSYLNYKVDKRNQTFLDNFPDALDMIVRSVKSGHPLLSSLRMIVDNSEEHIAQEFQQVIGEVSYGSPLADSLHRMAERINLMDINFFVVILSVQQETGGNLSEVLGNLSGIIRKRRQLRLKINAMTAEGRFTAWIFAAIPIMQLIVVKFIAPDYIDVLFKTSAGNILLAIAGGFIVFSIYISKKMCKIDI
jgi:tight adherence protein B